MTFTAKWKNRSCTKTYGSWRRMRDRCINPKNKDYIHYGARGIKVCNQWINDYDAFFEDMGEAPESHTIDRIDNNGHYEINNCRWSNQREQTNNTRRNRFLEFDNKRLTIAQWSRELKIPYYNIANRLKKNLPLEQILSISNLPKIRKIKINHGTYYAYRKYKCRCSLCLEAKLSKCREDVIKKSKFKNLKIIPEEFHGRSKGYDLCKCRCEECLEYFEYQKMKKKKPP